MLKKHCFYTSFNKAYTGQALLLAESLRRIYGDRVDIVALVVDEFEKGEEDYFSIFDQVLLASDLDIPDFKTWIFGLNIVEAATAVKPFGLCKLLQTYEHVTYLDPDLFVYSALDEIVDSPDTWDITLTPHQVSPQTDEWVIAATEMESLRFGVYNLGFLSVRGTETGLKVAQWWADRCYLYCVADLERGLFTDQKLFDLAPAIFPGVRVLRHPGYNVATWNICEREVWLDLEKGPVSNDHPLRFCHFTKATHIGATALDKMLSEESLFEELFYAYVAQLIGKKAELSGLGTKWAYGFFDDGSEIDGHLRKMFRNLGDSRWKLDDPFVSESVARSVLN